MMEAATLDLFSIQACECWEAKRFLTTVLGAQRRGTTVEIGAAGCLDLGPGYNFNTSPYNHG